MKMPVVHGKIEDVAHFYDPSALCKSCGEYLESPAHRIFRMCPWCMKEADRRRFHVKPVGIRRKAAPNG